MKDRIILLIKAKNLTAAQFADEIGVQKSSISHIISGRNNASLDFIQKILLRYPEVSMNWILFGKGSIFNGTENESRIFENKQLTDRNELSSPSVDLFSALKVDKPIDFYKENELNFTSKETEVLKNQESEREHKNIENDNRFILGEKTNDFKQVSALPALSVNSSKTIIKIVEFFSDNTYREYFPES